MSSLSSLLCYFTREIVGAIDKISWNPSEKGRFIVRSFYQILTSQGMNAFPWKTKTPLKVAFSSSFLSGQLP